MAECLNTKTWHKLYCCVECVRHPCHPTAKHLCLWIGWTEKMVQIFIKEVELCWCRQTIDNLKLWLVLIFLVEINFHQQPLPLPGSWYLTTPYLEGFFVYPTTWFQLCPGLGPPMKKGVDLAGGPKSLKGTAVILVIWQQLNHLRGRPSTSLSLG